MTAVLKDAHAEYQFDNDAAEALTTATDAIDNQTSEKFEYTAAGAGEVITITAVAIGDLAGDIDDIQACVDLETGKMDTTRPGGTADCS
jgi:uncharacterized protein YaiE (UPF0345 family)